MRPERRITILYVLDSLRFDYVGCFNNKARGITPNIDLLSENAIKCFYHIAPANWTLPCLASMLTGKHPCEIGVNYQTDVIPTETKRLPQYYSEMGYKTVGISANPFFSKTFNAHLGFDIFHLLLDFKTFNKRTTELFPTSLTINKNLFDIVERNKTENLFVMIWSLDTHNPYYVRDKNLNKFVEKEDLDKIYTLKEIDKINNEEDFEKIRNFYKNMIYQNDYRIGEIINFLKNRQLFDSSTICILSDHGETLTKNNFGHNGPLFREQIHTPFILKTPKDKKSLYPSHINHITSMDNILSTLMKIDFNIDLKGYKSIFENYRNYVYSVRIYSRKVFFYESITTKDFQIINTFKDFIPLRQVLKNLVKKYFFHIALEKPLRKIIFYLEGKKFSISLEKKDIEELFNLVRKKYKLLC